ncbi:MAG: hypothetical protein R2708_06560 [Vicinamibacterales bacterium]
MDRPLGRAVGNALEIRECVETLAGRGPDDLVAVVNALGVRVLQRAGRAPDRETALVLLDEARRSGAGLRKLRDMVAAQGGDPAVVDDPSRLPAAPVVDVLTAAADGPVSDLDAALVGRAAVLLGAGREKKGDPVDHAAGVVIRAAVGDLVTRGDPVLELHGPDAARVAQARAAVTPAVVIGGPIDQTPLVRAHVDADGRVEQF